MQRKLVCYSCGTLDRLPPYEGDPEYDMALIEMIRRHLQRADNPDPGAHRSDIFNIKDDEAKLIDAESEIQRKMHEAGVFIRETRDELKLDALKCFQRHSSPQQGCIDYHDKSKVIGRSIGVPDSNKQYLCDQCPVQAYYTFKARQSRGMYDVPSWEKALM